MGPLHRLDPAAYPPEWRLVSNGASVPTPTAPILVVLSAGHLTDAAAALDRSRAGRSLVDTVSRAYTAVLGMEVEPQQQQADVALVAAVGDGPFDVLAIDTSLDGVGGSLLAGARQLISVGPPADPPALGPWTIGSQIVAVPPAGAFPTSGAAASHHRFTIPTSEIGMQLLAREPVARAIAAWLSPSPLADRQLPPWRETRITPLDDTSTVASARIAIDLDPPTWIVYRWTDPGDGRTVRHHAFLPGELDALVRQPGPAADGGPLGRVLSATGHEVVAIDRAPSMLGRSPRPAHVDRGGWGNHRRGSSRRRCARRGPSPSHRVGPSVETGPDLRDGLVDATVPPGPGPGDHRHRVHRRVGGADQRLGARGPAGRARRRRRRRHRAGAAPHPGHRLSPRSGSWPTTSARSPSRPRPDPTR